MQLLNTKSSNIRAVRWSYLLTVMGVLCSLSTLHAADRYYDTGLATSSPWFGATSWSVTNGGPYGINWTNGNTAIFNLTKTQKVQLTSADVTVAGITTTGAYALTLDGTSRRNFTFSSGSVVSASSVIYFSTKLDVSGNFSLTSGVVSLSTAGSADQMTYSGTATANGGTISIDGGAAANWTNANFVVESGAFRAGGGTPAVSLGGVTMNGGYFDMGGGGTDAIDLTIASLSGSGGVVKAKTGTGAATHQFTVNQATNTTFSGTLQGLTD